jgi:hypothetical protein
MRHRRDDKEGDEQAHAAIGDNRAGQYNGEHRTLRPKTLGHIFGDRRHRARVLHQLAEQGAKEKNREELHDELRRARHEGLRPVRKQRFAR